LKTTPSENNMEIGKKGRAISDPALLLQPLFLSGVIFLK
jgi:hypothetical protein